MNLTDRQFWVEYWNNKGNLDKKINANYILSEILKDISASKNYSSGIELGGFPGYYAIYLKKYLKLEATLFDYVIIDSIVKKLATFNELKASDVNVIEGDIFNYLPEQKYDIVLSVGLIEHFENTKEIIKQHLKFMSDKGVLFLNIPNFTGFNGWIQRTFDKENYEKHFIECMDPSYLHNICKELGLSNIKVGYYGGFMMWLENFQTKGIAFKILFKSTWFLLKVYSKIVRKETKALSPYINLTATF